MCTVFKADNRVREYIYISAWGIIYAKQNNDLGNMNTAAILSQAEKIHQQGDLQQAELNYQAALAQAKSQQEPSNIASALFGIATLYNQTKRFDLAIQSFSEALLLEPEAFDINFNALVCLVNAKQDKEAKKRLSKVCSLVPNDQRMKEQLAAIASRLGEHQQVIELLKNFSSLSAQAKLNQISAFMKLEQWPAALAHSETLVKHFPKEPNVLSQHAICLLKMQRFQKAVEAYTTLSQLVPNNAQIHIKFADLYLLTHQSKQARQELNKAILLGDQSIQRFELECKVCRIENDKAGALVAAEAALGIKPEAEFAWQVKQDLGSEKDNAECIAHLPALIGEELLQQQKIEVEKVYSYDRQHNLFTLAKAYEKLERYQDAFDTYAIANELQNQHLTIHKKGYQPQVIEAQYQRLRSFPYVSSGSRIGENALKSKESPAHYFIVGMPRSGTTLVNRVLSQQANFQSVGESNAVANLFENKLLYPNTQTSTEQVVTDLKNMQASIDSQYRELNQISDKQLNLVDKMPHNFRYVGAILSAFPNCKVVQMRRNLGDLALSIYSQFFNVHHAYACRLADIAHAIYTANTLMDEWSRRFPEQVIDVYYDELVTAPESQFAKLFSFCELHWDEKYLQFHQEVVASFTFSETQVRRPINTHKLGYWKRYEQQLKPVFDAYQLLEAT